MMTIRVNEKKRLITRAALRELANDIMEHIEEITDPDKRRDHLIEHIAGAIDAHCVLLQRALCVHCGNGVPLVWVEKWHDWLHNGELTCIAGRAREVMGIDPESQHRITEKEDGSPIL